MVIGRDAAGVVTAVKRERSSAQRKHELHRRAPADSSYSLGVWAGSRTRRRWSRVGKSRPRSRSSSDAVVFCIRRSN